MTSDPFFTFNGVPDATPIGDAAALLEDQHGGQVFHRGTLTYLWDAGNDAARCTTAVTLWRIKAATASEIGAAFGVVEDTIWAWHRALNTSGISALASGKRGSKGGSKLTCEVITRIHQLKTQNLANPKIAAQVGVSEFSVRHPLKPDPATGQLAGDWPSTAMLASPGQGPNAAMPVQDELPILAAPAPRAAERAALTTGTTSAALPVFAPSAHAPNAGLLLALPALQATGLLDCIQHTYGQPSTGFYLLTTMVLETVLRTLAGSPVPRARPAWTLAASAGSWACTGRRTRRRSAASTRSWPHRAKPRRCWRHWAATTSNT